MKFGGVNTINTGQTKLPNAAFAGDQLTEVWGKL
jgi:hypothetical protein